MIRLVVFFVVVAAAALGLAWLADRPGDVMLTWQGMRIELSLMTALAGIFVIGVAMIMLWSLLRVVLRLPSIVAMSGRARRRSKGFAAISRGMLAVGIGDARAAQRSAGEARRLLGEEPMTLLLSAQAAQLSGDRPGAEAAFSRMLDSDETRVLGLRGLFLEARRKGDDAAARFYADEAFKLAPGVGWVGEAALDYRVRECDWSGAVMVVEQSVSRRFIDKETGRRQRAELLTAEALQLRASDPDAALLKARTALKLDPGLVPAAVLAARRLVERTESGKAAKLLEAAWRRCPHPDLADAYLDVRPGDSALDRLARARTLLRLAPADSEGRFAIARAAIEAREYAAAREALQPLLAGTPTRRACLLMAEIEERDGGAVGAVREWLARASRAPADRAWIADGIAQDTWAPYSPATGRIGAFEWRDPPQGLALSPGQGFDIAPLVEHEPAAPLAMPAPDSEPALRAEPSRQPPAEAAAPVWPMQPVRERPEPARSIGEPERNQQAGEQPAVQAVESPAVKVAEKATEKAADKAPWPMRPAAPVATEPTPLRRPARAPAGNGAAIATAESAADIEATGEATPAGGQEETAAAAPRPQPAEGRTVVFPLNRSPDDPGPDAESEAAPRRTRRLFS